MQRLLVASCLVVGTQGFSSALSGEPGTREILKLAKTGVKVARDVAVELLSKIQSVGEVAESRSMGATAASLNANELLRVNGPSASPTLASMSASASTIPDRCAFAKFPIEYAVPGRAERDGEQPFVDWAPAGSTAATGLDFDGLWWMMGNPLAEEFISLQGLSVTAPVGVSPSTFPKSIIWPSNLKGRWTWPTSGYTLPGWVLMSFYALTEEPTVPQIVTFKNATHGSIVPIAGGSGSDASGLQYALRKNMSDASGDSWIRENEAFPGDPNPEYIYTLVRVVNPDGSPNAKWWPEFTKFAASRGISHFYAWGNDDSCRRSCEVALPCSWCSWYCS